MKNIISSLILFIVASMTAQVAIGKNALSSAAVSLEFGNENRGLILPWVNSAAGVTDAVNGTMIYDVFDKKVKVKYASGWKDLSIDTTGTVDTSLQVNYSEKLNSKSIIGTNQTDATPGVLVLSDTNKAMILPKVASPHLNIINPATGMMAYDTVKNQLAVFNGTVWTFWKP